VVTDDSQIKQNTTKDRDLDDTTQPRIPSTNNLPQCNARGSGNPRTQHDPTTTINPRGHLNMAYNGIGHEWKPEEIQLLKRLYVETPVPLKTIAKELGLGAGQVRSKVEALHLKRPFSKVINRGTQRRQKLNINQWHPGVKGVRKGRKIKFNMDDFFMLGNEEFRNKYHLRRAEYNELIKQVYHGNWRVL